MELNEGTLIIPVYQLPAEGSMTPATEFEAQDIGALSWAIGFTATF
jgi:hypothetical protein